MPLIPFVENHSQRLSVLFVLLASARIVSTYTVFNHTFDEPIHLACGMEWLDRNSYTCEAQHPPLARVAAALGPYLLGIRSQGIAKAGDMFTQPREGLAILYRGNHYDLTLAMARLGILPFFWVACAVVYWWGRSYGRALAAIAVFLFSFLPPVLAHAGLATTDMALTAFLGASFVSGLALAERPTASRAVVFGGFTGLAVLSKFTTLAFLPAASAVTFVAYWATAKPGLGKALKQRLKTLFVAIPVALLVIWAGYRFSFGRPNASTAAMPAPELYSGIESVLRHNSVGHWSYMLGDCSPIGFWDYYPVALSVKTPLAFLVLLIFGIVLAIRNYAGPRPLWIPLAFSAAVLQVAMMGHINIGIRHILPVYMGFSILAAAAVLDLLSAPVKRNVTGFSIVLLLWFCCSSLAIHPDYLAYFNALAGKSPELILVDSDLDWGQDIKRLSKRLRELGAPEVMFPQFIYADLEKQHGFPRLIELPDPHQPPREGYVAVGATYWKAFRFGLVGTDSAQGIWPDRIAPTERVGRGIFLWVFPPSSARDDHLSLAQRKNAAEIHGLGLSR